MKSKKIQVIETYLRRRCDEIYIEINELRRDWGTNCSTAVYGNYAQISRKFGQLYEIETLIQFLDNEGM